MEYKKQAFPKTGVLTHPSIEDEEILGTQEGMTLLDYFAAQALNGLLAKYTVSKPEDQDTICQLSYELADTMLKHRKNYIP